MFNMGAQLSLVIQGPKLTEASLWHGFHDGHTQRKGPVGLKLVIKWPGPKGTFITSAHISWARTTQPGGVQRVCSSTNPEGEGDQILTRTSDYHSGFL